jgi:hypothetical protein
MQAGEDRHRRDAARQSKFGTSSDDAAKRAAA